MYNIYMKNQTLNNKSIYAIRNKVNGKHYIGQTKHSEDRRRMHFWKLEQGEHYNKDLQEDYKKYGKDSFEFIILEYLPDEMSEEDMLGKEDYYIKYMNAVDNGYNIAIAGSIYSPEKIAEVKNLLMQGIAPYKVIDITDVGHTTVFKYRQELIDAGLLERNDLNRIPKEKEEKVKEMLFAGSKLKDIINECMVNKGTILKIKKELKLPIRKSHSKLELKKLEPKIKAMLLNDATLKEVAAKLNISETFVMKVRKKLANTNQVKKRQILTEEEKIIKNEEIKSLLLQGLTINEVYLKCKVYKDYVVKIRKSLVEAGLLKAGITSKYKPI